MEAPHIGGARPSAVNSYCQPIEDYTTPPESDKRSYRKPSVDQGTDRETGTRRLPEVEEKPKQVACQGITQTLLTKDQDSGSHKQTHHAAAGKW